MNTLRNHPFFEKCLSLSALKFAFWTIILLGCICLVILYQPSSQREAFNLIARAPFNHSKLKFNVTVKCKPFMLDAGGAVNVSFAVPSSSSLVSSLPQLQPGGINFPLDCQPADHVAVIVPYRDRKSHLHIFLAHIHPFLARQRLHYGIFIIEPATNETFNRGKLLNVGFVEAQKFYNWSCFVFHDVDLLPENDKIFYSCGSNPRHLSAAIDKYNYRLPYTELLGGVTSISSESFKSINGYSNDYWGWGGEDDDFSWRVRRSGYKIERFEAADSHYKMIPHEADKGNPLNSCRFALLSVKHIRWQQSGLNNLKYQVLSMNVSDLYVSLVVETFENASRAEIHRICGNVK